MTRQDKPEAGLPMLRVDVAAARDVHWSIWLGLPLASLAAKFLLPLLGPESWWSIWVGESGFVENATAAFLVPAIIASVLIYRRRRQLPRRVGGLILLVGIASLYFAGEEISWGQHYFHWKTPAPLAGLNDQNETNLHNLLGQFGGNLLNNVPRQILNISMVAAIVLPIVIAVGRRRLVRRPREDDSKNDSTGWRFVQLCSDGRSLWFWLAPNWRLCPIAAMALGLRSTEKILRAAGHKRDFSYLGMSVILKAGEFLEYCFALAILIYVLSIFARLRSAKEASPAR